MPAQQHAAEGLPVALLQPRTEMPARGRARGVLAGAAYGLIGHTLFSVVSTGPGTMSTAILLATPFTIGALAALTQPAGSALWRSVLLSICTAVTTGGLLAVLAREPLLYVVMGLPALIACAALGGAVAHLVSRAGRRRVATLAGCAMLAPFAVGAAETIVPPDTAIRNVQTQITIQADKAVIWRNITRVSEIQPQEQRFSAFHALGLPRPRRAMLSHDGVGAIRDATFAGGLSFVETVTSWRKEKELRFTIAVDRTRPVPPVIDAIDGIYFTVTEGRYRIEPAAGGRWILKLDSTQRLSTRFNWYASFWTDRVMLHLQDYILRIIRERCERVMS